MIIGSAKLAEQLGFNTLWMLDSHLLFREVYTMLGALAVSTTKIRFGTAVTNPLTRHPTVTASAFSTLDALTGADLGGHNHDGIQQDVAAGEGINPLRDGLIHLYRSLSLP